MEKCPLKVKFSTVVHRMKKEFRIVAVGIAHEQAIEKKI
jgi:hypothetical protein